MFWANIQVLAPSVYSRPPVPVVVPRFRNQKPLYRTTAEFLERSTVVSFESGGINAVMKLVRDDLTRAGRGASWVRYETKADSDSMTERVVYEHADRKDFLHQPARKWAEVDWTAKRSWLTKKRMKKRFKDTSGDAYLDATYSVRHDRTVDEGNDDRRERAGVWEIWCKSQDKVIWVSEGVDVVLDEGAPHLKLEGFFPCPCPAYGTTEPRSMLPVPDFVQYKDQLEEINELTGRISALTEALKVRGFYQGGARDLTDAIEAALKSTDDREILIPVSNWTTGVGSAKDSVVWLPLDMIAKTITQLVELRKQLINDVYEITGLSDIMRGSTEASETATAQQLKSQYGSIRIRDRQDELIRVARDLTRIGAEIIAENFSKSTLEDITQMDLPTNADVARKVKPIRDQAKQAELQLRHLGSDPRVQQMAQQNPQQAQQMMQQVQAHIAQLNQEADEYEEKTVTIEQVMDFLHDQKLRPFVLDIETDSTIAPDENAQKQRATEYLTAMGSLLAQVVPAVEALPSIAPMLADTIKFAQSQFRVGRQLDQSVEEFADAMKAMSKQPPPEAPGKAADQAAAQATQQKSQQEAQAHELEVQAKQQDVQIKMGEAQARQQIEERKLQADLVAKQSDDERAAGESAVRVQGLHEDRANKAQKHAQDMDLGTLALEKLRLEIEGVKTKTAATVATAHAGIEATEAGVEANAAKTDAGIAATQAGVEAKRDAASP